MKSSAIKTYELVAADVPFLNYRSLSFSKAKARAAFKASVPAATRRPSDQKYIDFIRSLRSGTEDLTSRLAKGEIGPRMWADLFKIILNDGHAGSWTLGRQRAGDLSGSNIDDYLAGIAFADGQADFLLGFMQDIVNRRYTDDDGLLRLGPIQSRVDLYLKVMRGTAGAGFVAASSEDSTFDWNMTGAEHCDDCPYMASQNPWLPDEIFANPGDGNTECLGNCKCEWVRSDGVTCFGPFQLAA